MDLHFVYMWQFATIVLLTRTDAGDINDELSPFKRQCIDIDNSRYCLYLYGHSRLKINWEDAMHYCDGQHQQFAVLHHKDLFDMMETFTEDIKGTSNNVHVWVAGIRDTVDKWYYIFSDRPYTPWPNHGPICGQDGKGENCAILDLTNRTVFRCDCNQAIPAVCSYITDDGCSGHKFGSTCFYIPTIDHITWYEANTLCNQMFSDGNLDVDIISTMNFNATMDYILRSLPNVRYIWVGITRKPWRWIQGNSDPIMVQYNWKMYEGYEEPDVHISTCLYIEPHSHGKWADKKCTEISDYFICQTVNETDQFTIGSTTTTTRLTESTSTIKMDPDIAPSVSTTYNKTRGPTHTSTSYASSKTTTQVQRMTQVPITWTELTPDQAISKAPTADASSFQKVYIAPIMVGVLVVLVIIIVAVICIRRRNKNALKQGEPQPHNYANPSMDTNDDDPETPYMITPGPLDPTAPKLSNDYHLAGPDDPPLNNPSNNETDPAELYSKPNKSGTGAHGNSIKGVMSHKTAKSGDIYSLSNKSTDDEDSGEGPSEPYSLPQKSDRQEEEDDLEDVIMDNPTYGSMQ